MKFSMSNKNKNELAVYRIIHSDIDHERPIVKDGYLTDYSVTDNGDIISYKGYRTNKPKILKPIKMKNGYLKVNIQLNNTEKLYSIHRLVALAFIPNPDNKPEVNHIDGNKENNNVNNLEWVTSKENLHHAYENGLKCGKKGSEHSMHKITENDAHTICQLLESRKYTMKEISDKLNISYSIVKKIKYKLRWKHISSQYLI